MLIYVKNIKKKKKKKIGFFFFQTEMYSLFDVEEDEEMEMLPGKSFDTSTSVYTLTNSTTAHHLNSLTRVTSS